MVSVIYIHILYFSISTSVIKVVTVATQEILAWENQANCELHICQNFPCQYSQIHRKCIWH